jgi:hypothetical protein
MSRPRRLQSPEFASMRRMLQRKLKMKIAFVLPGEQEEKGQHKEQGKTGQTPVMREVVIADITKRLAKVASELKMLRLSPAEKEALFTRMREAMNPRDVAAPKPTQTESKG